MISVYRTSTQTVFRTEQSVSDHLHLLDLPVRVYRREIHLRLLVPFRLRVSFVLLLLDRVLERGRCPVSSSESRERRFLSTFNTFFDDVRPEISFEVRNIQDILYLVVQTIFHHILEMIQ